MSKKKRPVGARAAETAGAAAGSAVAEPTGVLRPDGFRETVESIVIALILAFLFRTFEAEAFEIPTGSMGPTLMGRHKDVECVECGFGFQVGVSFEVDDFGRAIHYPLAWRNSSRPLERELAGKPMVAATCTCPMCRYTMSVDPDLKNSERLVSRPLSYSGDRIWVSKAPYALRDPERWDVSVFKYPLGASQNYIKRLVGLPNETVRIHRGNIYVKPAGQEQFTIARKSPKKVLATLQPVYDNDYLLPWIIELGWPARWQPILPDGATGPPAWTTDDQTRSCHVDAPADAEAWLGYHHIVPGWDDWEELIKGQALPSDYPRRAQLVSDFCSYNTGTTQLNGPQPEPRSLGVHWVGDLALSCETSTQSASGEVTLLLIEGGRRLACRLDLANGRAQLSIDGLDSFHPSAQTTAKGPGTHRLMLANVDDQLLLRVDGSVIQFDQPTVYPELANQRPTVDDLTPARIAVKGAKVRLSHLSLGRDLYYIATRSTNQFTDYAHNHNFWDPQQAGLIADFLATPSQWGAFDHLAHVDFPLGEGQFLALGDNSPNSGDSRFWVEEHYVERELLIGKAFFVYWPHAWETGHHVTIPLRGRELHVPFYPNFADMRLIH